MDSNPAIEQRASHCFGCGPDNPQGLHLHFDIDSTDSANSADSGNSAHSGHSAHSGNSAEPVITVTDVA